jgi:hypothetical protein
MAKPTVASQRALPRPELHSKLAAFLPLYPFQNDNRKNTSCAFLILGKARLLL